ncbi:MAG: ArsC family reductase [Methylococcales bacterium]|nr:ArsC family reductase [Methylococcales bacterium]
MHTLYGISNCSTVKKAKDWLEDNNIDYQFHDYRKQGVTLDLLNSFEAKVGWEIILNRRSTSWRKLSDEQRDTVSKQTALQYMQESPTLIKRPILDMGKKLIVGYTAENYQQVL